LCSSSSRWRAWIITLLALAARCGSSQSSDPTLVPVSDWAAAQATLMCTKIFSCCSAADISGFGYAGQAACLQTITGQQQMSADSLLALGVVVYDGHAARRCLDEATPLACADFFPYGRPTLSGPSCDQVFTGTLQIGDACGDLDVSCESGDCASGACVVRPCSGVTCDAGQYCDPGTSSCAPVKLAGALCNSDDECDPSEGCRDNTCGPTLAPGVACAKSSDCETGACHAAPTSLPSGVCGAPLADGSACTIAQECASGGCSYAGASAGPVCGPVVCAGTN
jgi:hypothetical protein